MTQVIKFQVSGETISRRDFRGLEDGLRKTLKMAELEEKDIVVICVEPPEDSGLVRPSVEILVYYNWTKDFSLTKIVGRMAAITWSRMTGRPS